MAAQVARRPVKLALTRQQMFPVAGYRSPTIQRVQLGAQRDGQLTAIAHDIVEQTATIHEFADLDRRPDAGDVRSPEPPHHAPAGTARRPSDRVDARTR